MAGEIMWRSVPSEKLHTIDEQRWPAQPHSLPLPNEVLREASSVADLTAFLVIGEAWSAMVAHYLPPNARVLDLGCGCGKQARFLYLVPGLTYVGIDLYKPSILWCEKVFAREGDRFRFVHFDGQSEIYNPGGRVKASEYVFPLEDGEIDMAICASLFTHLHEPDARHYLREICRTLKRGGQAIISIHVSPEPGKSYSGNEARIDIDEDYFKTMCAKAGLIAVERIGVIYGQTAYLLRRK